MRMFSSENKGDDDDDILTLQGPNGRAIKISKSELINSFFGGDECSNCQGGCCSEKNPNENNNNEKEYIYYPNIADSHHNECGCGCGGGCGCENGNDGECCGRCENDEGCGCGGGCGCHNH